MQEKLAKTRPRAKILENMELGEEKKLQGEKLGNRQESLYSTQIKKENSEASCSQQDRDYLNPVYQAAEEKEGFSSEKKNVDALYHLVEQQSVLDIELDVFHGNPLDFHYFMTLFHKAVEKRIDDPRGRLARLLKWECKRDDQTLCTRTTNYGLSTCPEDTSGKIWKSLPCYGRI